MPTVGSSPPLAAASSVTPSRMTTLAVATFTSTLIGSERLREAAVLRLRDEEDAARADRRPRADLDGHGLDGAEQRQQVLELRRRDPARAEDDVVVGDLERDPRVHDDRLGEDLQVAAAHGGVPGEDDLVGIRVDVDRDRRRRAGVAVEVEIAPEGGVERVDGDR